MERKKELKQQYQEIEIVGGVYQIKNNINGKLFVEKTRNIKTINGVKFTLNNNTHKNKKLQSDWSKYGKDAFSIDILEVLKKDEENPYYNEKEALKEMEQKWLDQLKPSDENGYN